MHGLAGTYALLSASCVLLVGGLQVSRRHGPGVVAAETAAREAMLSAQNLETLKAATRMPSMVSALPRLDF